MATSFTNILVPVDFSENTDLAVQKTIELADPANSVIHLFYVANSGLRFNRFSMHGFFASSQILNDWYNGEIEMKLDAYKQIIIESLPLAKITTRMVIGRGVRKSLIEIANQSGADLIIIGKRKSQELFSLFNTVHASIVARRTNCAVLSVKRGAVSNSLKSIVLPVRSFVPERKIELLLALTHKQKPTVHSENLFPRLLILM